MKRYVRLGAYLLTGVLMMHLTACRTHPEREPGQSGADGAAVHGIRYTDHTLDDAFLEMWENENGLNNDACITQGIVVSPYFELTVCGEPVPVYMARTARGPHSFAYVEVLDWAGGGLDVEIVTDRKRKNPVVLPESAGVSAAIDGNRVTADIMAFGSYTFTFDKEGSDDGSSLPLTLMVKPPEAVGDTAGAVHTFEPGEYPGEALKFTEPGAVYYFKAGTYTIDSIDILADNVTVYFEPGVLLIAKPLTLREDGTPAAENIFSAQAKNGVSIIGHAALDLSFREAAAGTGVIFSFTSMTNMVFSGLTVLNSCNWTCCFTGCESVEIRDLLLLGYHTFSDGVMLADCADVRVDGCFVRTGDDAMEVKSGSAGTVRTKNVVFENNAVWTDKGIAYGAVYESAFDQSDVVWRNNSVGYALADWSRHLGCVTVSMEGRDPTVRDHHLYFQDIEIYRSHCPVITVMMHNGGYIHDIYFQSIHAKEVVLNRAVFGSCIDLIIGNDDGGPLTDFVLRDLYFDDITYNGVRLAPDNADREIRGNFPDGFAFDRDTLHINTREGSGR